MGTGNNRQKNRKHDIHHYKRHLNQIRRRRLDDPGRTPQEEEEAIETLCDTFDIEPPQAAIDSVDREGRGNLPNL